MQNSADVEELTYAKGNIEIEDLISAISNCMDKNKERI